MPTAMPRCQTAPSLTSSSNEPDQPVSTRELVRKVLTLLHLFLFHLFPALFFGILGLIFDQAARLFNAAAAFFRKENLPPTSPHHRWQVKRVLQFSTSPRQNAVDDLLLDASPVVPHVHSKRGLTADSSLAHSVAGPVSEPVSLLGPKPRRFPTSLGGSNRTSSSEASIDTAQIEKELSGFPRVISGEPGPSFLSLVHTSPMSSTEAPAAEHHIQRPIGNTSRSVPTALEDGAPNLAIPCVEPVQYSSVEAETYLEDESPEDEASELEPGSPKASHTHLPIASETVPENDPFSVSPVQSVGEPLANPDSLRLRSASVQKPAPPPPPYHVALEQSLHRRSTIASATSKPCPTPAYPGFRFLSSVDGMLPSITDAAARDLEMTDGGAGLSPVEEDRLQRGVDKDGSEIEVSGESHLFEADSVLEDDNPDVQKFVAARVDAYEDFLIAAEAELDAPLKLPIPDSSALEESDVKKHKMDFEEEDSREVLISKLKSSLSSAADADHNSLVKNLEMKHTELPSDLCEARDQENNDERRFEDREAGEVLGRCSSKAIDVLSGSFAEPDITDIFAESKDDVFLRESRGSAEAPAGVESLQELIPEVIPDVTTDRDPQPSEQVFPENETAVFSGMDESTPEATVAEGAIVSVASMEGLDRLPSFTLPRTGSDASLKTESYSSPDSPIHSSSTESASQSRHRDSWRASDHDLFAEDPMVDMESGSLPRSKQFSRQVSGSHFDRAVLEDFDSTKMVTTPAVQPKGSPSLDSSDNEIDTSTPVTSSADRDSAQSRMDELESVQSWRYSVGRSNVREDVAENAEYRQASIDLTSIGSSIASRDRQGRKDRARSKIPRLSPSHISGRTGIAPRAGRPVPESRMGRSMSTSEARFEDWPEYRPSKDDVPAGLSRRHQSDMSFGSKTQKNVHLPEGEPKNEGPVVVGYMNTEDEIPHRFGGPRRGWKFGFGRSPLSKEGGDVKGVMKNILRRRRKVSNIEESLSPNGYVGKTDSHHRSSVDKPSRRSVSMEPDFAFEIELPQDSAYALLRRICPDCGYRIVVTRPHYKMKIEIPVSGGTTWLLASITLSKVGHGRGTHMSISRSKEDMSGGVDGEIEAVGLLLRTRLGAHVEFLEDSFASLQVENPVMEMRET